IHIINTENFWNIQPVATYTPNARTTPHNPYILGNSHAVVSCYQDGLYIYNISNPEQAGIAGFFDTYPQGGANTDSSDYGGNDYRGNWGAYPYLPSGIIIAQDMQNGVFILNAARAFSATVDLDEVKDEGLTFNVYPNPTKSVLNVDISTSLNMTEMMSEKTDIKIIDAFGNTLIQYSAGNSKHHAIAVNEL